MIISPFFPFCKKTWCLFRKTQNFYPSMLWRQMTRCNQNFWATKRSHKKHGLQILLESLYDLLTTNLTHPTPITAWILAITNNYTSDYIVPVEGKQDASQNVCQPTTNNWNQCFGSDPSVFSSILELLHTTCTIAITP